MTELMNQIEERIRQALAADRDPYLDQDLISADAVADVVVDGRQATVNIRLGFPAERYLSLIHI